MTTLKFEHNGVNYLYDIAKRDFVREEEVYGRYQIDVSLIVDNILPEVQKMYPTKEVVAYEMGDC